MPNFSSVLSGQYRTVFLWRWVVTLALAIGLFFAQSTNISVYAQSGSTTYVVQRGDTLSSIAARHGLSYPQLAAYNNISDPNRLRVGQVIRIPSSRSPAAPAQTAPRSYPSTSATPAPTPTSSRSSAEQSPATRLFRQTEVSYTVVRGDSLFSISARYGVTVAAILRRNNLRGTVIYVGQRLIIPPAAQ
jgi:LysM repeat protein